jgi:mannose-6-phosphate isomerase-like protein (cupin superfamily)
MNGIISNGMKKGYKDNIEKLTTENNNFRQVLYSGEHCQLVLMSLLPNEEIGMEIHTDNDQFFRFEKGSGQVIINDMIYEVKDGDAVIVPCGANHNVTAGNDGLKLYTIYSPAHHKDGIVRSTKKEAEENGADFDGVTTEQ